ncbi:hypothetical protein FPSE_06346 [Fusarium pseudograminearum CS3096]|uniref:Uncharacterized protein n=1 Tax=Fusarium pseudograminearum (strain CS3096) TaxID=1028729 RepID=K3UMS5_FUSPC|nr:hypothetical protein FPSE_06346 [Fusarium pseudograminearum CS3096]EKJ73476.1 hypothetical protein FPSE_06346 [Fusarium pseudograminearum CS3096]
MVESDVVSVWNEVIRNYTCNCYLVHLLAVASLLGNAAAGPCKSSRTLTLSTSTTEDFSSTTSRVTSSIVVDTTLSLTLDTALSSVTEDFSLSTVFDYGSTSTDITLSTSTDDASSSTTNTSTSWTTYAKAVSTTETTSSVETSLSMTEISTTTQEFSTATAEAATTTEATITTSDAPAIEPTFALQVANSAQQSVNGKRPRYKKGSSGNVIYLTVSAALENSYVTGDFHLEASTNRLMVGDMYTAIGAASAAILFAETADDVASRNHLYISCNPLVQLGQKLECVTETAFADT